MRTVCDAAARHGGDLVGAAARFGLRPQDIADFSASLNPLGPPPGLRAILLQSLGGGDGYTASAVAVYPDPESRAARQALAEHLGVMPGEVLLTNGGAEAIHLTVRWWAQRGGTGRPPGRVVVLAPSFSEYTRAGRAAGAEVLAVPLDPAAGFAFDPGAAAARLRAGDLLFVANPNNPTGQVVDPEATSFLLARAAEAGAFLAVDEAFLPFLPDAPRLSAVPLARRGPGLVVVGSLTKFFCLPGLRIGYAAGSAPVIAGLAALQPPWSVNALAQAAVPACLADAEYAEHTRALIARERRRLEQGLSGVPGLRVFPSTANFLLVDCRATGRTAREWYLLLGKRGFLIRDCADFPGLDPYYFRVAVRGPAENDALVSAMASPA